MTLRGQMLVAGLLTLLLPLSGWQSVRELDASLREGRAAAQRLALAELELAVRRRGLVNEQAGEGPADGGRVDRVRANGGGELPDAASRPPLELYAERAVAPIQIDGYADDWRELGEASLRIADAAGALQVRAAELHGRLHLMIDLSDDTPVWHRPPRLIPDAGEAESPDALTRLATGDALQLLLYSEERWQHGILSPIAPGDLAVRYASSGPGGTGIRTGDALPGWQAAWTDRPGGHRIELSIPLPEAHDSIVRLGIAAIDVPAAGATGRTRASVPPLAMRRLHETAAAGSFDSVPRLYRASPALQRLLAERVPVGARARAFDHSGRLLADVDRLNGSAEPSDGTPPEQRARFAGLGDALLFRVFAFLVAGDMPLPERAYTGDPVDLRPVPGIDPRARSMRELAATQRYVTPQLDRVLGTLRALGEVSESGTGPGTGGGTGIGEAAGWLWYETNEEHSATYAGSRLARVFALLFLAGLTASVLSFGWASWLSFRIRRLSRAAMRAVAADGRVRADGFPSSRAHDEIGNLSRNLGTLLHRSGDYHRYLEALGGRLSHELRTPLAVLAGCLEHLRGPHAVGRREELLARADGAARELDSLLESLLMATRLEQTLQRATRQRLALDAFLAQCRERHRLGRGKLALALESLPPRSASPTVLAAPELLVQAIDKLIDNAADFGEGSAVAIVRYTRGPEVFVGVSNAMAPRIRRCDAATRLEWFEPMVSRREPDGGVHLGLGLHLVALVAEHHGGRPDTLAGPERLAIGMWLPLVGTQPLSRRPARGADAPGAGTRAE